MSFRNKIVSLALLSLPCISMAHAVTNGVWNTTSGVWSTAAAWGTATPPELAGDTATIGTSNVGGTITVDIAPIIQTLTFENGPFTLTPSALPANVISFDTSVTGGPVGINVISGNPYHLTAPPSANFFLHITSGSPMTISVIDPAGSLNFQSNFTSNGNINFTSGIVNLVNTTPISSSVTGAKISSTSATSQIAINANVTLSNSATVVNGPFLGVVQLAEANTLTLNSGSLNLHNTGSISNTINATSSGNGVGAALMNVTGGNLSLLNEGSVTGNSTSNVFGNFIFVGDLEINGGTINLTNTGPLQQSGVGNGITSFGTIVMNGGSLFLNNTGTVQLNNSIGNAIGAIAQLTINGGTIISVNSGIVDNASFGSLILSPLIEQNGGVFINDANVHTNTLSIGPGALYAGKGITSQLSSPLTVTNSGTVSPVDANGNPGSLTINGTYTQNSNGTLAILIENNSTYSQLVVNGTANLAGTLQISQTPNATITSGSTFAIVKANQVTGTFSSILSPNIPSSLKAQLAYNPNSVDLSFLQVVFTPTTEKYVKLAQPLFSSLNETNTRLSREMEKLRGRFAKPKTEPVKQKPQQKGLSAKLVTLQDDEPLESFLYDEPLNEGSFFSLLEESQEEVLPKEKSQRLTESLKAPQDRPWNFYVGPKGQIGNVYSKDESQGFKEWSAGAFTGADYAFSQVGVGLLAEYERITAHAGENWGKFTIDNLHADAYATYAPSQLPEIALNGILGAGYQWYKIDRNFVDINSGTVKGTPRGAELDALLGIEYAFRNSRYSVIPDGFQVIPMASIQYAYLHIDDFKEKGNPLHAMKISKQNVKSLRSNLGVRFDYTWKNSDIEFSPAVNLGWQREFLDKKYTLDFTPLTFQEFGFSVKLPRSGRNIALAGIDLLLTLFDRHGLEAGYDFEYNSLYHTHFVYMSYNVRF